MRCRTNAYKPANILTIANCYEIKCMNSVWTNEYWLWDHTEKTTWFHIRLALSFFHCYQPPAKFSQQTMVLSLSTNPGLWKLKSIPADALEKPLYHNLVCCPINTYNFFFQYCRHRRPLCNYHLIFLTTLPLLNPQIKPDCHPDTRSARFPVPSI